MKTYRTGAVGMWSRRGGDAIIARMLAAGLALLLCAPPAWASETAGKVLVTRNQVDAERAGEVRPLTRKADVFSGDIVRTGSSSRVGMRFVDGSIVSLDEGSSLQIREFSHQESGQPDAFIIELLSGGFRNLTGAISKVNPDAYQVKTPLASLSIRGTYYYTSLNDNRDQLSVFVWKGSVQVFNEAGSVEIGPDYDYQGAIVHAGEAPKGTDMLDSLGGLGTEFAENDVDNEQQPPDGTGGGANGDNESGGGLVGAVIGGASDFLSEPLGSEGPGGGLLEPVIDGGGDFVGGLPGLGDPGN